MEDEQFNEIIKSYEIKKKVDKILESKIIENNIRDINDFIRKTDLEIFLRLYNLKHSFKFKKYDFKKDNKYYKN